MFVYCETNTNVYRLREGQGKNISWHASTEQWHCDWIEGKSISLDLPTIPQLTYNMSYWQVFKFTTCGCGPTEGHTDHMWLAGSVGPHQLLRVAYQGSPSLCKDREIGVQPTTLTCMTSEHHRFRSWWDESMLEAPVGTVCYVPVTSHTGQPGRD